MLGFKFSPSLLESKSTVVFIMVKMQVIEVILARLSKLVMLIVLVILFMVFKLKVKLTMVDRGVLVA